MTQDYDMKIHSNPDAQAWAKFFIQTKKEASWQIEDIDESLMLGWFANAMMAMHDSQRTWVGLTDEDYFEIGQRHWLPSSKAEQIHKEIEEAAHDTKEKNK